MELDGDPEVMRHINGGAPLTEDYLRDEVLPRLLNHHAQFSYLGYWAAHEKITNTFVGWFYLLPTQDTGILEVGYRLKQTSWGKGYATEMTRALVALVFEKPGTSALEAETMVANRASIRVVEKIGFRFIEYYTADSFRGADKRAARYRLTREQYEDSGRTSETLYEIVGWILEEVRYELFASDVSHVQANGILHTIDREVCLVFRSGKPLLQLDECPGRVLHRLC
jgi:RimJ/RimL family protein N-acetyltransferase